MTDETDTARGEILKALDRMAASGMPFIDYVKAGGFASFKQTGAKPMPLEPVQIYEDSPFWNKVKKMEDMQEDTKTVLSEVWQGETVVACFTKQVSLEAFKAMYPREDTMQDHIKRLAVEAGLAYEKEGQILSTQDRGWPIDDELTAFAQAVARECAKLAVSEPRVWDAGAPDPQTRIANSIRARFGLEG